MIYVARVLDLCGAGAPARDCRQRRAADIRLLALRKYSALKNDSILEKDSPSTKRLALGWRSAFSAANEVVFYARALAPEVPLYRIARRCTNRRTTLLTGPRPLVPKSATPL